MEIFFVRQGDFVMAARAKRPDAKVAEWQERTAYALEIVHREPAGHLVAADLREALGEPARAHGDWYRGDWSPEELAQAVASCRSPGIPRSERRRRQDDFRAQLGEVAREMAELGEPDSRRVDDLLGRLAAWEALCRSPHERVWVDMLRRELDQTIEP